MSIIQTVWDCGVWRTLVTATRYVGRGIQQLNPLRYLAHRTARTARPQPECVWMRPNSRW